MSFLYPNASKISFHPRKYLRCKLIYLLISNFEFLKLFADCQGPLKCFQRSGDEDVPGCIASEVLSEALPEIDIDESVGNNKGAAAYGRCQGGEYMHSPY